MRADLAPRASMAVVTLNLGERFWVQKGRLAACDPSISQVVQAGLIRRALMKLAKPKGREWLMMEASKGGGRLFLAGLDPGEALWIEEGEGAICRSEVLLGWSGEGIEDPAPEAKLPSSPRLVRLRGRGSALISLAGGGHLVGLAHGQTLKADPVRLIFWDSTLDSRPDELGFLTIAGPGRVALRGALPEWRSPLQTPGRRQK